MIRWEYLGLALGGAIGLLLAVLLLLGVRPATPPPLAQPAPPGADVTLFFSEQSLSRVASTTLAGPAAVDCEPDGQMRVMTRLPVAGLRPVVQLGLSVDRQGTTVISQLQWAQVGFLRLPVSWLPPEIILAGALPGQVVTQQIPPQFTLVGLATTADGITVQLNWTGQPF